MVRNGLEQAAGANGVADALVNAVFRRNVVVKAHALGARYFDAVHDVIAVFHHLTTVR